MTLKDIKDLVLLSVLAVSAWILPERLWPRAARVLGLFEVHLFGSRSRQQVDLLRRVLGDRLPNWNAREIEIGRAAAYHEDRMQVFGSYRPGGWVPRIELCGRRNLEDALRQGNGAVLWVSNFSSSALVTKMAFSCAGISVSHLSRPAHGFSGSRFGIRFLNPIRTRLEDRYLGARVSMPEDGSVAPFRTLRKRLRGNGVVSITVGPWARKTVTTDFLGGTITLATGPANLSLSAKAPLLPVFTVRAGNGAFEVHIGPPIDGVGPIDRDDAFAVIVRRYAEALEPHVLGQPGQWRGWPWVAMAEAGSSTAEVVPSKPTAGVAPPSAESRSSPKAPSG